MLGSLSSGAPNVNLDYWGNTNNNAVRSYLGAKPKELEMNPTIEICGYRYTGQPSKHIKADLLEGSGKVLASTLRTYYMQPRSGANCAPRNFRLPLPKFSAYSSFSNKSASFLHDVDAEGGQSGAPIWHKDKTTGDLTLIGLHQGATKNLGAALVLPSGNVGQIFPKGGSINHGIILRPDVLAFLNQQLPQRAKLNLNWRPGARRPFGKYA
jgi:hypothetical protein